MVLKYVVYKCPKSGYEDIVLLCEDIVHSQVVVEERHPIAAGEIDLSGLKCFGHSISLKLESRGKKDWELFELALMPSSLRTMKRLQIQDLTGGCDG